MASSSSSFPAFVRSFRERNRCIGCMSIVKVHFFANVRRIMIAHSFARDVSAARNYKHCIYSILCEGKAARHKRACRGFQNGLLKKKSTQN